MKKEYVRPVMVAEEFLANEYVAACSATFNCNVDISGTLYKETNDVEDLQRTGGFSFTEGVYRSDTRVTSSYKSCSNDISINKSTTIADGYVYVIGVPSSTENVYLVAAANGEHSSDGGYHVLSSNPEINAS